MNKYRNEKVEIGGHKFSSRLEASCFEMLHLQEKGNLVRILELQPKVYLTAAKILYKPDFKILDLELAKIVFIEAKGFETPEWKLKCRLWQFYGPGILRIFKKGSKQPKLTTIIIGNSNGGI